MATLKAAKTISFRSVAIEPPGCPQGRNLFDASELLEAHIESFWIANFAQNEFLGCRERSFCIPDIQSCEPFQAKVSCCCGMDPRCPIVPLIVIITVVTITIIISAPFPGIQL